MKILLVEDDMEIGAVLKYFLMTEHDEAVAASDGENACETFFRCV
jgi:DNA-binding response OmpR family regulator